MSHFITPLPIQRKLDLACKTSTDRRAWKAQAIPSYLAITSTKRPSPCQTHIDSWFKSVHNNLTKEQMQAEKQVREIEKKLLQHPEYQGKTVYNLGESFPSLRKHIPGYKKLIMHINLTIKNTQGMKNAVIVRFAQAPSRI